MSTRTVISRKLQAVISEIVICLFKGSIKSPSAAYETSHSSTDSQVHVLLQGARQFNNEFNMANKVMARLSGLTDREAVIDAVLRMAQGLDDADPDLLRSAFVPDAVFDVTPVNKIGRQYKVLHGVDTIVEGVMGSVGPMDTTHSVTNFRVQLSGDSARVTAYAIAQHFSAGEGPDPTKNGYFLMGNRYTATAVRAEEGLWRLKQMTVDCTWCHGDETAMDRRA